MINANQSIVAPASHSASHAISHSLVAEAIPYPVTELSLPVSPTAIRVTAVPSSKHLTPMESSPPDSTQASRRSSLMKPLHSTEMPVMLSSMAHVHWVPEENHITPPHLLNQVQFNAEVEAIDDADVVER